MRNVRFKESEEYRFMGCTRGMRCIRGVMAAKGTGVVRGVKHMGMRNEWCKGVRGGVNCEGYKGARFESLISIF